MYAACYHVKQSPLSHLFHRTRNPMEGRWIKIQINGSFWTICCTVDCIYTCMHVLDTQLRVKNLNIGSIALSRISIDGRRKACISFNIRRLTKQGLEQPEKKNKSRALESQGIYFMTSHVHGSAGGTLQRWFWWSALDILRAPAPQRRWQMVIQIVKFVFSWMCREDIRRLNWRSPVPFGWT